MTFARDKVKGEKIDLNINFNEKSKLKGSYYLNKKTGTQASCEFDFQHIPLSVFNKMTPPGFYIKEGDINGSLKCLSERHYEVSASSEQFKVGFIKFNKDLKKLVSKSALYKDEFFSQLNMVFNEDAIRTLDLVNRKYNARFSRMRSTESVYFLSVLDQKIEYKTSHDEESDFVFVRAL